jgi:uncharacterized protein (TIGR02271 family)
VTFTDDQIRALPGAEVYDNDRALVGTVGQVWADTTGQPSWVSVNTGLYGPNESLLPLPGAQFTDGRLYTPYDRVRIQNAPNLDVNVEQPLDSDGLGQLYAHYALSLDQSAASSDADASAGRIEDDDAAMTRSEEHLRVGTERVQTGKVRLRKYTVTEYVTVTVPVRREEIRLEHVPAGQDDSDDGAAHPEGVEIGDDEHEIILHAERPVVTTETVPVERVRFGKQTVTEQQTVSGEVRKEHIDLDLPGGSGETR